MFPNGGKNQADMPRRTFFSRPGQARPDQRRMDGPRTRIKEGRRETKKKKKKRGERKARKGGERKKRKKKLLSPLLERVVDRGAPRK